MPVLLSVVILPLVDGAVRPFLLSAALVFVIDPVAVVVGAIGVKVCTFAVRFLLFPITDVEIAICVD